MYLTIVTIVSICVAIFSLKALGDNQKEIIDMYKRYNEQLREDIKLKQEYIKLIDKMFERVKDGGK